MNISYKDHYLDAMGIQRWRANFLLPGASADVSHVAWQLCRVENGEPTGVLLLESPCQQKEIMGLLDKMLTAIALKRDIELEGHEVTQGQLTIVMGEMLAQKVLHPASLDELRMENRERVESNDMKVLVTYHPERLLEDPGLKQKAWEDLKIIKP